VNGVSSKSSILSMSFSFKITFSNPFCFDYLFDKNNALSANTEAGLKNSFQICTLLTLQDKASIK
jgi:flagellar assembly factor FliW